MRPLPDRIEDALDAALDMTFPASDPVAVFMADEEGPVAIRVGDGRQANASV